MGGGGGVGSGVCNTTAKESATTHRKSLGEKMQCTATTLPNQLPLTHYPPFLEI